MEFLLIILFVIIWFLIEYLCIHFEVKHNPSLFYSLHQNEIIRVLNKLDKKGMR